MKKVIIGIAVLVILFLSFLLFGSYSDGFRAGTLVKLSKKGYIFKTYEGQLNLGGLSNDTGSPSSALWNFSVDNSEDEVLKELDKALLSGKRVKLYYKEKYVLFFWQGDSKYYVYRVETVQ